MNIVRIFREIVKLIMFALTWGFPIYLVKLNGSNHYLWFFILSFIINVGVFSHYEDLGAVEHFRDTDDGKK